MHRTSQIISQDKDEHLEIEGYKINYKKLFVTWIGYIITLGFLKLLFYWYPQIGLKSVYEKCELKEAVKVLVIDNYQGKHKSYFVKNVKQISITSQMCKYNSIINNANNLTYWLTDSSKRETKCIRAFWAKKHCYIWDNHQNIFFPLQGLEKRLTNNDFHKMPGLSIEEQNQRRIIYGKNEIIVPVQTVFALLLTEILNPFYIFQIFALAVWISDEYYYYSICIIIMTICGISFSAYQTRKNQLNLKNAVESIETVQVCRTDGSVESILSSDLVPGDIIIVSNYKCALSCDAVLLEGQCIVDESMLTGESIPIIKTAITKTNSLYDAQECKNHTLLCGTNLIQTTHLDKNNTRAIVIRTGYLTTKGQLVRNILYPPPVDYKFDKDSYKFIRILALIAALGFIYTLVSKSIRGLSIEDILIKGFVIITVAVPPALPASMTIGKLFALCRLKKKKIFCTNSKTINLAGSTNCVCFDKTGTLTESDLSIWGVIPVQDNLMSDPIKNINKLEETSDLFIGMLTCHSLIVIDNKICGDPLDLKMFQSTNWQLKESINSSNDTNAKITTIIKPLNKISNNEIKNSLEIIIIKQYPFLSSLQRMSVIVNISNFNNYYLYCKGSPEVLLSLCIAKTVPANIQETLTNYTKQGYRVIALGCRILRKKNVDLINSLRENLEKNLVFQGLIIFENKLKRETTDVIKTLKKANLKIVMITGDNIYTALNVASECEIINKNEEVLQLFVIFDRETETARIVFEKIEKFNNIPHKNINKYTIIEMENISMDYKIAMTGETWLQINKYFPELISKLLIKGTVFARMIGQQKQQLVSELQTLGYYVAMCGDGANDCEALKTAHIGISLSETESSIASPFTSIEANISCVPKIIIEGRAALVTSFGIFKFMIAYSLTEFLSVIILYGIDANLTNVQFMFIDIFLVLNFALFFGKTKAFEEELIKEPPTTSLLSCIPQMSLILFMITASFFQYFIYYYIKSFQWYQSYNNNSNNNELVNFYENYSVFCLSLFQYIIMAIVFSKGKPYRQPLYTNFLLIISIIIMIIICTIITIYPNEWIRNLFELELAPTLDMRLSILVAAFLNFIISIFCENVIVDYIIKEKIRCYFKNNRKSQKIYSQIEKELNESNSIKLLQMSKKITEK